MTVVIDTSSPSFQEQPCQYTHLNNAITYTVIKEQLQLAATRKLVIQPVLTLSK